ncbi:MAG: TIGR03067 domain-containing protein [Pirellulales bacterium]|nr:TIGR03067 domain-containing protein [Pirellulales bacterium]
MSLNPPDREKLLAYALGRLSDEDSERVAEQIDGDSTCQALLATLDEDEDTLVGKLRWADDDDPLAAESHLDEALARAKAVAGRPAEGTAESLALGTLGEYRLLARLGRGGMGTVYKALHTKLDRIVALKVIAKHRMHDPQAVARFEREMKAIGRLDHPAIVHAFDAREIDGTPVLVMEHVDGMDLGRLSQRVGPLRTADACELIRQAALGLDYAHQYGLVHRDVKPSNLMLTRSGELMILDLGLARLAESPKTSETNQDDPPNHRSSLEANRSERSSTTHPQPDDVRDEDALSPSISEGTGGGQSDLNQAGSPPDLSKSDGASTSPSNAEVETPWPVDLTATNQIMGTADYMAPEQADNSRAVDIRADIYSLGCTLYKLLCGTAPFDRTDCRGTLEKMAAHADRPVPPIDESAPDLPRGLVALLNRMLSKSPDARPSTPADVAAALELYTKGHDLPGLLRRAEATQPAPAPLPSASGGRRRWIAALVATAFFFGAIGLSFGILITVYRNGQKVTMNVQNGTNMTFGPERIEVRSPGTPTDASPSPDSSRSIEGMWEVVDLQTADPGNSQFFGLYRVEGRPETHIPGIPIHEQLLKNTRVIIDKDSFRILGGENSQFFDTQYRLKPDASPMLIDLDYNGGTLGICKREGDRLTLCFGTTWQQPTQNTVRSRPTEFWPEVGSFRELIVLRRVGPVETHPDQLALQGKWRVVSFTRNKEVDEQSCVSVGQFDPDQPGGFQPGRFVGPLWGGTWRTDQYLSSVKEIHFDQRAFSMVGALEEPSNESKMLKRQKQKEKQKEDEAPSAPTKSSPGELMAGTLRMNPLTRSGRFELVPGGRFSLSVGMGPGPGSLNGIYRIEGDRLTFRFVVANAGSQLFLDLYQALAFDAPLRVGQYELVLSREGAPVKPDEPSPTDASRSPDSTTSIEGTWEVVDLQTANPYYSQFLGLYRMEGMPETYNNPTREQLFKSSRIVIDKDAFQVLGSQNGQFFNARYRLKPDASPMLIDLDYYDGTLGICKREGDRLTLCVSYDAGPDGKTHRPTEFWPEMGSSRELIVLRRLGPAKVHPDIKALQGKWRVASFASSKEPSHGWSVLLSPTQSKHAGFWGGTFPVEEFLPAVKEITLGRLTFQMNGPVPESSTVGASAEKESAKTPAAPATPLVVELAGGRVAFNPLAAPGRFCLTLTGLSTLNSPTGIGGPFSGIYRIQDDRLTLRFSLPSDGRAASSDSPPLAFDAPLSKGQYEWVLTRAPKPDREAIVGTWKIVKAFDGGRDVTAQDFSDAGMIVDSKIIRFWKDGMRHSDGEISAYSLDPTRKPKHIDTITNNAVATPAIYDLQGDRLRLCVPKPGKPRPTRFSSDEKGGNLLFELERVSPSVPDPVSVLFLPRPLPAGDSAATGGPPGAAQAQANPPRETSIEGEWKVVRCDTDKAGTSHVLGTYEITPGADLGDADRPLPTAEKVFKAARVVITEDRMTVWSDRLPARAMRYRLDADRSPTWIDVAPSRLDEERLSGACKRQGDELTLSLFVGLPLGFRPGVNDRPNERIVLRRTGPVQAHPDEKAILGRWYVVRGTCGRIPDPREPESQKDCLGLVSEIDGLALGKHVSVLTGPLFTSPPMECAINPLSRPGTIALSPPEVFNGLSVSGISISGLRCVYRLDGEQLTLRADIGTFSNPDPDVSTPMFHRTPSFDAELTRNQFELVLSRTKPPAKPDSKAIVGTWRVVKAVHEGRDVTAEDYAGSQALIDATTLGLWNTSVGSYEFHSYTLDPSKKPKHINIVIDTDMTVAGIYDLHGNRLRLCLSEPVPKPGKPRPTEFSSTGKNAQALLELTRVSSSAPKIPPTGPTPTPPGRVIGAPLEPPAYASVDPAVASAVVPLKDGDALKGLWQVVSLTDNGDVTSRANLVASHDATTTREELVKGTKILISDSKLKVFGPKTVFRTGEYRVNTDLRPTPIDFQNDERVIPGFLQRGICKLEGDRLTICLVDATDKKTKRPEAFWAELGTGQQLIVLKWIPTKGPHPDETAIQGKWNMLAVEQGPPENPESTKPGSWPALRSPVGLRIGTDSMDAFGWYFHGHRRIRIEPSQFGDLTDYSSFRIVYAIDPRAQPKAIHLDVGWSSNSTTKSVYKLDGDRLTIRFFDGTLSPPSDADERSESLRKGEVRWRLQRAKPQEPNRLVAFLRTEGRIFVDDKIHGAESFRQLVAERLEKQPDLSVLIEGVAGLSFGEVQRVAYLARKAGAKQVRLGGLAAQATARRLDFRVVFPDNAPNDPQGTENLKTAIKWALDDLKKYGPREPFQSLAKLREERTGGTWNSTFLEIRVSDDPRPLVPATVYFFREKNVEPTKLKPTPFVLVDMPDDRPLDKAQLQKIRISAAETVSSKIAGDGALGQPGGMGLVGGDDLGVMGGTPKTKVTIPPELIPVGNVSTGQIHPAGLVEPEESDLPAWFELATDAPKESVTAQRDGWLYLPHPMLGPPKTVKGRDLRRYVLLFDQPSETMLARRDDWGITGCSLGTNSKGVPQVVIQFDTAGIERLAALSKANQGRAFAVLVDDVVVDYFPSMIGSFTNPISLDCASREEAKLLAASLKAALKPTPPGTKTRAAGAASPFEAK